MLGFGTAFKLQAKFALIVGAGILAFGLMTIAVMGYLDYSTVEQRLQARAQSELTSVDALVDSEMKLRFEDATGLGVKVFEGWFKSRNEQFEGKLWSAWGPSMVEGVKKDDPTKKPKLAQDDIDREVLKTGHADRPFRRQYLSLQHAGHLGQDEGDQAGRLRRMPRGTGHQGGRCPLHLFDQPADRQGLRRAAPTPHGDRRRRAGGGHRDAARRLDDVWPRGREALARAHPSA